ncbi:MAG: MarR family winged helix-turn-helix transcriptional regulator [Treponema sp.]|jgi:DNA-binding MarR family transcriptional regulator|nr:MarR family winged helix-turn-helix transcriptional regulator [Treponema sp.]
MSGNFDCCRRILVIGNRVRRFLDSSFVRLGLTGPQGAILHFVYVRGKYQDVFQRDIEAAFDIRRSSVTSVIHGLEQSGFIRRESVEDDGRLKKLTLTDKAVKISKRIAELLAETNKMLIKNLGEQDVDYLDRMLAKIEGNIP